MSEPKTFHLERFTVHERTRFDNPAWPVYLVFFAGRLVGKSFSRPDIGCCEWLERQTAEELVYAECSAKLSDKGREHTLRGIEKARAFSLTRRRGRPTNAERERQDAWLAVLAEEIP